MKIDNHSLRDLLGEARAIHLAMRHGQISYEEAKKRVSPILSRLNLLVDEKAKKYKVKPRYFKFQDLGANL